MGEYTLLMMKSITLPDRWSMFFKQLIKEIYKLGVDSLWIVIIISVFIGTVIAIQISLNISSPLIPKLRSAIPPVRLSCWNSLPLSWH